MKVLVIGATGFVGKAIVAELRSRLIDVVAVGGPRSASLGYKTYDTQLLECIDVTVAANLVRLESIEDVDAVVHAAGLAHQFGTVTESDLLRVNVNGTENVAKLAVKLKVKRFILISSVLVYGKSENGLPVTENSPCRPDDAYGRSKLAAENIAVEICKSGDILLTILRPAPIIGEGSKGNFLRLIKSIAERRFLWIGKGRNLKSLVVVDDVAKACGAILEQNNAGTDAFNVSGPAMEMREIVDVISQELSRSPPSIFIPAIPVIAILRLIPGRRTSSLRRTVEKWLSTDIYSGEKLRMRYGFSVTSDLAEAIRREVNCYKKTK